MKVVSSIESLYYEQIEIIQKLEDRVKPLIFGFKPQNWFYTSRLKSLESFALKFETGRFTAEENLEDFFACTLVVENLNQINSAESLIRKNFVFVEKRPKELGFTHKLTNSFEFDDLRMYVKPKRIEHLNNDILSEVKFEIQIKTFLQHAWGIATHDLVYKSDIISWPKERVAYQIKAMLEQAEVMISGVDDLVKVPELSKQNYVTQRLNEILDFYLSFFLREDLPKDIVRLCKNTDDLLKALGLKAKSIKDIIKDETDAGRGTNLKNLSPYLLVIQSIINQKPKLLEDYLNDFNEKRFKIFIPNEVDISSLNLAKKNNGTTF